MEHPNSDRLSKGFTGNEKFRIENYDLSTFNMALSKMHDLDYVENHMIDWDLLPELTNDLINERLYTLQSDIQRTAFLTHYFRGLIEGVRYMTLEIAFDYFMSVGDGLPNPSELNKLCNTNSLYGEIFASKFSFFYTLDCFLTLNKLVLEVSDTCLMYDGINFDKIIENAIYPFSRTGSNLNWYIKGGGMKCGKRDDSGPYQPEELVQNTKIISIAKLPVIKDLFNDPSQSDKYIDLLKNRKPAVVNDNNEFILGPKSKAVVVAWFDALERKGIINNQLKSIPEKTAALNSTIKKFSIAERSMSNSTQKSNDFYNYFLNKIR